MKFSRTAVGGLRLALVPVAVLSGAGVLAQTSAETSAPTGAEAAGPTTLERVTVSATKRLTFVQDTPVAVSAFTGKELERSGVKDLSTMQSMVPNLSIEQHGDSGGVHVFLRGIGSTNHTELGDPAVAFHVDGVYSPRPQGATVLMYDLESVEVARGPQGTLFGRNATAGSVNLNTAKPKLGQYSGSGSMLLGDRNRTQMQGALSLPLSDTMAVRVAAIQERQDGWVDFQARSNVQPGARKYGANDQTGVRTTLLWEPSPAVTATLAAEYYRDQGTGQVALMQHPRAGQKLTSALIDTPGHLDQDIITYRGRMDWRPSDAVEVSYIGSWSALERQNASDNDAGTGPGFKQEHRTEWSRFVNYTHELNVKSTDAGPFQWIAGAFMIKEDNKIRFDIDISRTAVPSGEGPIVIHPVLPSDTAWAMSFIQPKRTLDSKAVFGQGSYALNRELKATVGARYTQEKKQDIGGRNWVCPDFGATVGSGGHLIGPGGPVDAASCHSAYTPGTWPGGGANDGQTKDNASTYLLRMEYKPQADLMTYATLSTGFKSGGLSDGGRRHLPEKLTNYELGAKAEFFQRSLALNVAAFLMKYKDMQVSAIEYQANGQQQLVTSNAARATIKGLEAELTWRLTPHDRLSGNASLLDAHYDDFLTCDSALLDCAVPSNAVNLKGNKLPHAPRFSTTLSYEHDFALASGARVTPRVGLHYQSRSYLSNFNSAPTAAVRAGSFADARTQDGYAKVDLALRYEEPKGRWEVEAFVTNATDKMVKTDASWIGDTSTWVSFYNPPRTYGVKAAYRF